MEKLGNMERQDKASSNLQRPLLPPPGGNWREEAGISTPRDLATWKLECSQHVQRCCNLIKHTATWTHLPVPAIGQL